jgi:hypothetical protein
MRASKESTSSADEATLRAPTIQEFRAEYRRADLFCQEVQSFVDLAGVPAINELRNAGKHLIDALTDDGAVRSQDDLAAGTAHCRRACYEAYEAGILAGMEIIEKFKSDYATVTVGDVIPDYTDILYKAQAAQKSVEVGRHPEFDRTQDHATRMAAFRELRACAERLMIGREEMNKKVDRAVQDARGGARNLAIAAVGLGVAIVGLGIVIF